MQRRRRRRQRLPCALRLREYVRQFVAFLFSNVGVICLVVGYIIAGAFIFQAIEGSSELARVQSMARQRQLATERLWENATVPLNVFDELLWKRNVSAELRRYERVVVEAISNGWDGSDDVEFYRQWSFPGSFLYSLTIITTIGYGNIAPRTDWGKVTTIFYAMLGMPLFLLYLTNLGDLLARSFKWFYVNLCLCRGCPGIAKSRATRLRMQMQAQLGQPLDLLRSTKNEQRCRSAPVHRTCQRCSDIEISIPLDSRYPGTRRGVSVPIYYGQRKIEAESERTRAKDRHRAKTQDWIDPCEVPKVDKYQKTAGCKRFQYRHDSPKNYNYNILYKTDKYYRQCQQYSCYRYKSDYSGEFDDISTVNNKNGNKKIGNDSIKDGNSICTYQIYDTMDNDSDCEDHNLDEVADSDDFTYITIDSQNVTVPITICVFIMAGYIAFGAMLFSMWEEWDRVDGSYFCFISLTSIGFGDIVPGERIYARGVSNESTKRIDTSFILCSMYLLFGMALVAMCFNLMQEQVTQYIAGAKRVLGNVCRCRCR